MHGSDSLKGHWRSWGARRCNRSCTWTHHYISFRHHWTHLVAGDPSLCARTKTEPPCPLIGGRELWKLWQRKTNCRAYVFSENQETQRRGWFCLDGDVERFLIGQRLLHTHTHTHHLLCLSTHQTHPTLRLCSYVLYPSNSLAVIPPPLSPISLHFCAYLSIFPSLCHPPTPLHLSICLVWLWPVWALTYVFVL